jgi:hypothetical protein
MLPSRDRGLKLAMEVYGDFVARAAREFAT